MTTIRPYSLISACGLNCGLCPRFHTEGSSRCPGCGGQGFYDNRPKCGVISCCQKKEIEYCYECVAYPCIKYKNAFCYDSFITHQNMEKDFQKIKTDGLKNYQNILHEKMDILQQLLTGYNDGRKKSFFCLAVNLLEIEDVRSIFNELNKVAEPDLKTRAKIAETAFNKKAEEKNISLKLIKK